MQNILPKIAAKSVNTQPLENSSQFPTNSTQAKSSDNTVLLMTPAPLATQLLLLTPVKLLVTFPQVSFAKPQAQPKIVDVCDKTETLSKTDDVRNIFDENEEPHDEIFSSKPLPLSLDPATEDVPYKAITFVDKQDERIAVDDNNGIENRNHINSQQVGPNHGDDKQEKDYSEKSENDVHQIQNLRLDWLCGRDENPPMSLSMVTQLEELDRYYDYNFTCDEAMMDILMNVHENKYN